MIGTNLRVLLGGYVAWLRSINLSYLMLSSSTSKVIFVIDVVVALNICVILLKMSENFNSKRKMVSQNDVNLRFCFIFAVKENLNVARYECCSVWMSFGMNVARYEYRLTFDSSGEDFSLNEFTDWEFSWLGRIILFCWSGIFTSIIRICW